METSIATAPTLSPPECPYRTPWLAIGREQLHGSQTHCGGRTRGAGRGGDGRRWGRDRKGRGQEEVGEGQEEGGDRRMRGGIKLIYCTDHTPYIHQPPTCPGW